MQPGDVQVTYDGIERVGAKLGFEPKPPITDGIPAIVEWVRQHTRPSSPCRKARWPGEHGEPGWVGDAAGPHGYQYIASWPVGTLRARRGGPSFAPILISFSRTGSLPASPIGGRPYPSDAGDNTQYFTGRTFWALEKNSSPYGKSGLLQYEVVGQSCTVPSGLPTETRSGRGTILAFGRAMRNAASASKQLAISSWLTTTNTS